MLVLIAIQRNFTLRVLSLIVEQFVFTTVTHICKHIQYSRPTNLCSNIVNSYRLVSMAMWYSHRHLASQSVYLSLNLNIIVNQQFYVRFSTYQENVITSTAKMKVPIKYVRFNNTLVSPIVSSL